jgi:ferredoxin
MVLRKIIKIDESLCTGCGECITACAEGAVELKGGIARVVSDSFCDGLGACLAVCPEGALSLEEREADVFDETSAAAAQSAAAPCQPCQPYPPCQPYSPCPPCSSPIGLQTDRRSEWRDEEAKALETTPGSISGSTLANWPIQMRLVRPTARGLQGSRLLVAADCTAFAYHAVQQEFIQGRVTLVGCPKLDPTGPFVDGLAQILQGNEIKDIAVLHMTVPCCAVLESLVQEALKRSGKDVPVKSFAVTPEGRLMSAAD